MRLPTRRGPGVNASPAATQPAPFCARGHLAEDDLLGSRLAAREMVRRMGSLLPCEGRPTIDRGLRLRADVEVEVAATEFGTREQ
jgi:hypothetical protein